MQRKECATLKLVQHEVLMLVSAAPPLNGGGRIHGLGFGRPTPRPWKQNKVLTRVQRHGGK